MPVVQVSPHEAPLPRLVQVRRTILVADVVESVRLMQKDEAQFIDSWRRFVRDARESLLPPLGGRVVKSLGDGMLLEFDNARNAVLAAFGLHDGIFRIQGAGAPPISLRIGIHVADVAIDADDLFGTGVNLASRVAAMAAPGHTVVTADTLDELVPYVDAAVDDLGECYFKHIDRPIRCFRVQAPQTGDWVTSLTIEAPPRWSGLAILPPSIVNTDLPAAAGHVIAEELIALVSRSEAMGVVARLSTSALAGRALTLTEVGRLLGVEYCLTGFVKGDRSQVTAEFALSSTTDGRTLWSSTFHDSSESMARRDGDMLCAVAAAVSETIACIEVARTTTLAMPNLDSYTLMVGGVMLMHRTGRSDFARARSVLEHLVERSGRHPIPRAWLAKWHVLNVQQGWSASPEADARAAIDLTARALDEDPDCALACTVQGFARANVLRDFETASECYRRALALNPNDSLAWLLTGMLSAFQGEGVEAETACDHAQRLSPLDPLRYFYLALGASSAVSAGHYERAIVLGRESLRLNRSHLSTHRALTAALELAGRHEEAGQAAKELMARDPGFTVGDYLNRTPGRAFAIGKQVAEALRAAGVPAH